MTDDVLAHRSRTVDAEKQEALSKERQRKFKLIAQDYRHTFSTPEGKRVFRHLMEVCGFHKVSIIGDPQTGDIHDRGTLYNEARRNVYLEARAFLTNEILKDIEFRQMEDFETSIDDL